MADNTRKRNRKGKSKVSLPAEDEPDWSTNANANSNNTKSRPNTTRRNTNKSRPGTAKGRPTTAKSNKKPSIDATNTPETVANTNANANTNRTSSNYSNYSRTHSYQSSTLSMTGTGTPTSNKPTGLTYRDVQESLYPPPIGQKHSVMGKKKIATIPNRNNIVSAVQRGFKHNRRIEKSRNFQTGQMTEEQTREVSEADAMRLNMMNNYFAEKIDEYSNMIDKCKEDARRKREKNKSEGVRKINALGPFMMSKKFYNMMEADISQVYIAYRRLSSTSSTKKMGSYDHIMYDDQIKDGLVEYKTKFVHLVCKPYQCWMNLFNIDESAAKELSEVGLLVLEHFNKVGRYKQAFPKWLIDLRGWEHSIAVQYMSKAVHIFEVVEHIKNGNYWARYHQYLREENDDVYLRKWHDGTDYFPHKSTALYWYFHESDIDHWMTLEEYMNKKKMKSVSSKSKKNIFLGDDGNIMSDDSTVNMSNDELNEYKAKKRLKGQSRQSIEDKSISTKVSNSNVDGDIDKGNDASDERDDNNMGNHENENGMDDDGIGGVEYLDNIVVSDSSCENEMYSSSASDDSIPVNKHIYRCPQTQTSTATNDMDGFDGWTAYHKSFIGFINRDLLQIDDCEREMARNPSEDHWRRRHLALGNGFDLPVCQYRLISKKLNLEHEVRENLRMIAILKKNGILSAGQSAELTLSKYMPEWVKFKAQTHFNKLYPQIRKQQLEYTPQKKQLLETLKLEIQIREKFNNKIRQSIADKKNKLSDNLNKLKQLHDRQIALINYIVTAKHRVANAKLKVAYARKRVEILENNVKDLRQMTPREQEFAKRNKHYYEAVSINKLCKQYHSLKRNNYDPNQAYLRTYREKIKSLLKKVALYNLWYWSIKQRYLSHKKYEVIAHAFNKCNPCKSWNVSDSTISELLLSDEKFTELNSYDPHKMRKEQYLFKLKENKKDSNQLPDDDEEKEHEEKKDDEEKKEEETMPQIKKDEAEFERTFHIKKRQTDKYTSISMGNQSEQMEKFNEKLQEVMDIMRKFEELQRKSRPNTRHSVSSSMGYKRRRISESSIPGLFAGFSNENNNTTQTNINVNNIVDDEDTLARQLAGAQRHKTDDFDDDEDEYDTEYSDDEDDDDNEYSDTENTEENTEFSENSESFDSHDDYYDEDQYQEEDDMRDSRMQHIKPTIYTDDDDESVIQTDSEDEMDMDMQQNIKTHKREHTLPGDQNGHDMDHDMDDDDYDEKKGALNNMGESGFMSFGVNDRTNLDHFDDDEYHDQNVDDDDEEYDSEEDYETGSEYTDDEDYESESVSDYDDDDDDEDYDEQETQDLQNKYGGSGALNQQHSFSMAGGGGYDGGGGNDSFNTPQAMLRDNNQQSFSMAGGGGGGYGLVDPNQYGDSNDSESFDTQTGDDED